MNVTEVTKVSVGDRFHVVGIIDEIDDEYGIELKPIAMDYLGHIN